MGNSLSLIKEIPIAKANSCLTKQSISRVKEMFGGFKNLCESYALSYIEFEQIFDGDKAAFALWDDDQNGMLHGLPKG